MLAGDRSVDDITAALYRGVSAELPDAARGTVWAHLESLAALGLAVADGPATMTTTYRAVPNE